MVTENGYLIGATRARVVAAYLREFGYVPAQVFRAGSTWRAGPVGSGNVRRRPEAQKGKRG